MNNYIITTSCGEFRLRSRQMLRGRWSVALLATFFFVLLTEVAVIIPYVGSIWAIIASGPLTFGLYGVFLAISRNVPTTGTNVFKGFNFFGKTIGLFWFQALFVFLWSLLFIIPGIIAALRYSMAYYIMLDDPSKGIQQCVNESKAMMKGNKGKLFLLYLSFIGWFLLAGLVTSIPELIFSISAPGYYASFFYNYGSMMYSGSTELAIVALFTVLLSAAAIIPLSAYLMGAVTQFYNELKAGISFNTANGYQNDNQNGYQSGYQNDNQNGYQGGYQNNGQNGYQSGYQNNGQSGYQSGYQNNGQSSYQGSYQNNDQNGYQNNDRPNY